MKTVSLSPSLPAVSRLAYGCWRIAERDAKPGAGRLALLAAVEAGYTLFDHADIYCDGGAEKVFGELLKEIPSLRARLLTATKCGIRKSGEPSPDSPYRYDFSADYIIRSCEGSLRRLGVETIDIFQLHRPDFLMDPAEVAGAFEQLRQSGKAREFGVSNFKPSQLAVLQSACPMRLVVNQVEISLANLSSFDDGTLDQCLAEGVTPMAWSPLAGGKLGHGPHRVLPAQEGYKTDAVNAALDGMAKLHGVDRATVALAWLLKHPSRIMPIVGSIDPARIREAARADAVELSREDWYRLLEAARDARLP